jgi:hypothetical protein
MNTKTRNGTTMPQAGLSESPLPAPVDNPFLEPAWAAPLRADIPVPSLPDGAGRLTKKQRRILEEGQAQLLQHHFQRGKAAYAVVASAQIDDLANHGYVWLGTNIVRRKRGAPAELQPYLALMMDAQLRRIGQELNTIAADHARTQNAIASQVIEIDEADLLPFWAKLLRPVTRGS